MEKPLEIQIRPSRIGGRAVGWYAEVNPGGKFLAGDKLFYRRDKRAVIALVARLKDAKVTVCP